MPSSGAPRQMFYFQFITTPTSDTPGTSLVLHFDSKRYLFGNVSEGTQRACIQRGVGPRKIRNIFVTGKVDWKSTGGLIGMILTLADSRIAAEREAENLRLAAGNSSQDGLQPAVPPGEHDHSSGEGALTIHGGDNILHTMACARRFVFRQGIPIAVNEFEFPVSGNPEEPAWKDENIRVWPMPIAPSTSSSQRDAVSNTTAIPSGSKARSDSKRIKRSHGRPSLEAAALTTSTSAEQQRDRKLKQKIVSDMFNSEWDRDVLFPIPLSQVQMPAALFVHDPLTEKTTTYRGPRPGDGAPLPDIEVLVRDPWPGAMVENLPRIRNLGFKPAMSYIVQGYPQRGRFDPRKAKALGVERGPSYSFLAAGNSVTVADGSVVTADMVLGPTKPGRGFAIIDLPSTDYVANLIDRSEWKSTAFKEGITAICWILGPGLTASPALKDFMASMPQVEHIVSSTDVCPDYLALDSCAATAIHLSRISPKYFPVPVHDNATLLPHSDQGDGRPSPRGYTPAMRGLKIEMEPQFAIKGNEIPPLLDTAQEARNVPQRVQQRAQLAQEGIMEMCGMENGTGAAVPTQSGDFNPEIITLGTSAASPSKYRNVSATLLRTEKFGNFLFDCGENTLGQLKRVFDAGALSDVLRNLKFIWISHLHADHHLGTVSVLAAHEMVWRANSQQRTEGETKKEATSPAPVIVASESNMLNFLEEYQSIEAFPNMRRLYCSPQQGPKLNDAMSTCLRQQLGIINVQTTAVDHSRGAQAISITFENGFKFSYSGDCRPSIAFATIGHGSDVLVHEATFDDDMEGDALAKKHCTTGEALGVAAQMGAKNVILTHFSQRYQKLPVIENMKLPFARQDAETTNGNDLATRHTDPTELEVAGQSDFLASAHRAGSDSGNSQKAPRLANPVSNLPKKEMNIVVAFDYMRVRVSDMRNLQKFTPALTALFEAEQTELAQEQVDPAT